MTQEENGSAGGRPEEGIIHRKVILPALELLRQGMTPEKIALTAAVGIALGIFPVIGATTILCTIAAIVLRLNLPAIQLVNYLAYPLQLALLVPFMMLGARFFGPGELTVPASQILALVRSDTWRAVLVLRDITLRAVLAWLCTSPFAALLVYLGLKPLIKRLYQRDL